MLLDLLDLGMMDHRHVLAGRSHGLAVIYLPTTFSRTIYRSLASLKLILPRPGGFVKMNSPLGHLGLVLGRHFGWLFTFRII